MLIIHPIPSLMKYVFKFLPIFFVFVFIILFWHCLFFFKGLFIYLFMAVLGLRFCARAFPSCGKWGPLFIAVRGPLTIAAFLVAEHRLQTRRISNCGSRAQLLHGTRDPPRPGLEPMSPALAGRLSTAAPPGKPLALPIFKNRQKVVHFCNKYWEFFRYKICPIHNVFWRLISKGQWFWDFLPLLLFLKIQAQQKYPFHWPSLKSVPMFIICIPLFVPSLSCPFNYIFSFW